MPREGHYHGALKEKPMYKESKLPYPRRFPKLFCFPSAMANIQIQKTGAERLLSSLSLMPASDLERSKDQRQNQLMASTR
jgi:hypothetical protein